MSSEMERFEFFAFLDGGVALLDCHQSSDGSYVRYEDHEREVRWAIAAAIRMQDKCAALEAECKRLREALDQLANGSHLDAARNHDDDSLREIAGCCTCGERNHLLKHADRVDAALGDAVSVPAELVQQQSEGGGK